MPPKPRDPNIAWVRAQIPRQVMDKAQEIARRCHVTTWMVFNVYLTRDLYDADVKKEAEWLRRNVFNVEGLLYDVNQKRQLAIEHRLQPKRRRSVGKAILAVSDQPEPDQLRDKGGDT